MKCLDGDLDFREKSINFLSGTKSFSELEWGFLDEMSKAWKA